MSRHYHYTIAMNPVRRRFSTLCGKTCAFEFGAGWPVEVDCPACLMVAGFQGIDMTQNGSGTYEED